MRVLLMPLAWIYDGVTRLRNYLYDRELKPSASFEVPVIAIGNLTVGGTGKTPMTEYLVSLLRSVTGVAVLSRGYKRSTRGFRFVDDQDSAETVGDEPLQLYRKFRDVAVIAVSEDRALGIPNILQRFSSVGVVLLDDGFQHRCVRPAFTILLTRFNRPFYRDAVLPAGLLRESARGAKRADLVVITKCPPGISSLQMEEVVGKVRHYSAAPVFFSSLMYDNPVPFGNASTINSPKIIVVTGIANPEPMITHLAASYEVAHHLAFGDHHKFRRADFERIKALVSKTGAEAIITTEKDYVRIAGSPWKDFVHTLPWFYLPVRMYFLKNGADFDGKVTEVVKKGQL